jgi:hypothetical protein
MDMGLSKFGLQHGLAPIYGTPSKKKNGSMRFWGAIVPNLEESTHGHARWVGKRGSQTSDVQLGTYKTTPTLDPFGGFGQLKLNATSHRFTCQQGEVRSPQHQW